MQFFSLEKLKKESYYQEVRRYNHYELHAHILPAVDDGATSMEMALQMIDDEIKQGVRRLILTPHIRKDEYDYCKMSERFLALQKQVASTKRKIKLYLGSEIFYDSTTIHKLQTKQAFTMAGSQYVLIEFFTDVNLEYINNAVNDLLLSGYLPILAHVERYDCLIKDVDRIRMLVEKGAYVQVNANSILNHPKRKKILKLIKEGYVHFVGTDCHRTDWRPVCIQEVCEYLARNIDKKDYCRIFFKNPQNLLANKVI